MDSRRKMNFWRQSKKRERTAVIISLAVLTALALCSLAVGAYEMSLPDIFSILAGRGEGTQSAVLLRLRLPRTAACICAGAVMGVTGAVCQMVFQSPLASPDITGVASGASLGAAAAIILGAGTWMRMGMAFAGGMAAMGVMLLLVKAAGGERRSAYVLAGIMTSSFADAAVMALKTAADPEGELAAIEFWTMGSMAAMTWEKAVVMLAGAVPALALLIIFSRQTLMLARGGDEARAQGLAPGLWRGILLALSTWAAASVVSVTGVIGFAGLIVPHIAFMLYKRRSGAYFILCAIVGGAVITASDIAARSAVPGRELPLSIFCVAFAVVTLTVLLIKRRERENG